MNTEEQEIQHITEKIVTFTSELDEMARRPITYNELVTQGLAKKEDHESFMLFVIDALLSLKMALKAIKRGYELKIINASMFMSIRSKILQIESDYTLIKESVEIIEKENIHQ